MAYLLEIPGQPGDSSTRQATLSAPTVCTVWGALRGRETFGQLVEWDWDDRSHVIRSAPWHIKDKPRFPHRAFMMDTARYFQPLTVFSRVLDGMAACKLNTLNSITGTSLMPNPSKIWDGRWSNDERYSRTVSNDEGHRAPVRAV